MNFKYPVLAHLSWNITMIMIPSGSMETRCHCQYIFCPDGGVVWVKISNKCPTWLWAKIWISIILQNSSILVLVFTHPFVVDNVDPYQPISSPDIRSSPDFLLNTVGFRACRSSSTRCAGVGAEAGHTRHRARQCGRRSGGPDAIWGQVEGSSGSWDWCSKNMQNQQLMVEPKET